MGGSHLTRTVKRVVSDGHDGSLYNQPDWTDFPDRIAIIHEQRRRAWRAYWRAAYGKYRKTSTDPLVAQAWPIIDWGLQISEVTPGGRVVDPNPVTLDWTALCDQYEHLRKHEPYVLLFAPLWGGQTDHVAPTELWDDFWLWPTPDVYPPRDPWDAILPVTLARSPYAALNNVLQAFPQHFDHAWDVGAPGYLTCRIRLPTDAAALDEALYRGMQEITKTLAAIRLTYPGAWYIPSAMAVVEPFLGQQPVWRWQTSAGPMGTNRPSVEPIDPAAFDTLRQWRSNLNQIPWDAFPVLPFVLQSEVSALQVGVELPEQYTADSYLEYALVLWDMTYGRSSTEAILNGWSLLELLTAGEKSSMVKDLACRMAPGEAATIGELMTWRNKFGHGHSRDSRRRHLRGDEIPRIHGALRSVMTAVLTEVSRDPTKYHDRNAIKNWAATLRGSP